MNTKYIIFVLFVLFLSISIVSANEMDQNNNVTLVNDDSSMEIVEEINHNNNVTLVNDDSSMKPLDEKDNQEENNSHEENLQISFQETISSDKDVIVVNNWEELQYYCAQTDKNYNLKLKENTSFYPSSVKDASCQIKIKNNVKIIGSENSYIGDSPNYLQNDYLYRYIPIVVEENARVGLILENITFKWIAMNAGFYLDSTMFIQIAGKKNSILRNCKFQNIYTTHGHSCILNLRHGTATLDNCSFINCTNSYGCLSVYTPSGETPSMTVQNCYFEGNYASTEPGCINNCAKLTVYNTTFYKNRSFWWAAAIHTHCGASTTIYDSNFIDNVAGWNGGALYTYSYLKVYNSIFIGNNCTTDNGGGAIGACVYESEPHIYIEKCLFEKNHNNDGGGRGGAISLMDAGSLEVRDTTFIANSAAQGNAICARAVQNYGTPDVIIVNNTFINHTRSGDVLDIRLWNTSIRNVSNNYYYGNSIMFSNLTLTKLSEGKEQASFEISNILSNPSYYDDDILNKTKYDVYINNKYVKTVDSTIFSIDFGDLDICRVYVIPTISNRKSNEVTATSTREYIFVSKSNGNDTNNGLSRDTPVSSISKALQLAQNYHNIILLDGEYSEDNLPITYDVTIKGEADATLTGITSFVSGADLTLKNLKINNLNKETFIKSSNNLIISNCILTNNNALLVQNNDVTTISNSILLNNSNIIQGNAANLDYNWWGNTIPDLNINKYITLNITSDVGALENNHKANVRAVFYLNDGTKYTNLPQIDLNLTAVNGMVNKDTTIADSSFIYTLTGFGDGILTVSYNDFTTSKSFEFLKSNPTISLTTDDIMVGDTLTITVTLPNDAEGNLTVNVGTNSQTKTIDSSKMTFNFPNLKADSYTITANYFGDRKYHSKTITSNVNVNKFVSSTNLNISTINVGQDVILTITTTDSTTGNVTLSINNNPQTVFLTNSKGEYTIRNIARGDYLITATYNGDDRYLPSQTSKFIEVDNLNASMRIETADITYGDVAVIKVILNDDASGEVTVTIDDIRNSSTVINGRAEVSFTNLEAGQNKNISVFYTGDNTYFNLTNTSSFNINKADLNFDITSSDIKIGKVAEITIKVPSKTKGTFTIGEDIMNIPLSGEVTYLIYNLEIGNYSYTATYNGNNYNTVSKTVSFEVSEYPIPQWSTEGGNTQNTHKSEYASNITGDVLFTVSFDNALTGELLLDSVGNVYLTTQEGIYCYNQKTCLWYFTSNLTAGNFSGIAIGRDVIIAPKSGDTLYFINQTSGERYGASNIYQGSSLFSPVIDSDANLYIVSEYQYNSEDYKLVIIPYRLWEDGGDPTLVTIGDTQPLCSPTLNENIIVVVSENRLRMIDAKTLETISIKGGNYLSVRPVIGDGDIVYAILSDSIVAYNAAGVQLWKTKVVGGVGNTLVIDPEKGVYHVNARGILYRFDILDGSDSKISNLKVTSGILIDSNSNLYFASNNVFYCIDSNGNVLWQSDLGSKITGTPVMNKDGVIYVTSADNKLFALANALIDPELEITVDNIAEGENLTISISINNHASGIVSFTLNNIDYSFNASRGNIVEVIPDLGASNYSVNVTYSGDSVFDKASKVVSFTVMEKTVSLLDPELEVNIPNISEGETAVITIRINNQTTGNVTFTLDNVDYSFKTDDGIIVKEISDLSVGTYNVTVIYPGDSHFNKTSKTVTFNVRPKSVILLDPELEVSIANITEGEKAVITIRINNQTTGNVTFTLDNVDYSFKTGNGLIIKEIQDLKVGTYDVNVTYPGDLRFNESSKMVSFTVKANTVPLMDPELDVTVSSISQGEKAVITIKINNQTTGNVSFTLNNVDYSFKTGDGIIVKEISNLNAGTYTVNVTYPGDSRFMQSSKTASFTVKAVTSPSVSTSGSAVTIKLASDATGTLTVKINGKTYTKDLINGEASITLPDGTYNAVITYSGDSKYAGFTITKKVSVKKPVVKKASKIVAKKKTFKAKTKIKKYTVTLKSGKTPIKKVKLIIKIKKKTFKATTNSKGKATFKIKKLTKKGKYTATIKFQGNKNYKAATKKVKIVVK